MSISRTGSTAIRMLSGKSLTLGDSSYTIVGVLPPKFHLPAMWEGMDQKKPEVWVPLSRLWRTAADDTKRQLYVIAKLKPGVSLASSAHRNEGNFGAAGKG